MIDDASRAGDELERAIEREHLRQTAIDAAGLVLALWFTLCTYAWFAR